MMQLRDLVVFKLANAWLFLWAGVFAAFFMLLGLFAKVNWFLELFVNFIPEYTVGLFVCMIALLLYRKPLWSACLLPFFLFGICLLIPFYLPGKGEAAASGGGRYKLVAFNVLAWNKEFDKVAEFLERENPDFIVLTEFTAQWNQVVKRLKGRYEVILTEPHVDNFGIALLGRFKGKGEILRVKDDFGLPLPCADFLLPDGGKFRLIGVHALLPAGPELRASRNRTLLEAATLCHEATPSILAGDFNMTPFSPCYKQLLEKGSLHSATQGRGLCFTWPSWGFWQNLPFSMQIDHCLLSKGVSVLSWRTGPYLGSDHSPVILEFTVTGD